MALSDKAILHLLTETKGLTPCSEGRIIRERSIRSLLPCDVCEKSLDDTAIYHPGIKVHPGCSAETV
jgi:hypothetical protein